MMTIQVGQNPLCHAAEEHRLRRLGVAVTLLWRNMPEPMKAAIVNQAELVPSLSDVPESRAQLIAFLDAHCAGEKAQ